MWEPVAKRNEFKSQTNPSVKYILRSNPKQIHLRNMFYVFSGEKYVFQKRFLFFPTSNPSFESICEICFMLVPKTNTSAKYVLRSHRKQINPWNTLYNHIQIKLRNMVYVRIENKSICEIRFTFLPKTGTSTKYVFTFWWEHKCPP